MGATKSNESLAMNGSDRRRARIRTWPARMVERQRMTERGRVARRVAAARGVLSSLKASGVARSSGGIELPQTGRDVMRRRRLRVEESQVSIDVLSSTFVKNHFDP